MGWKRTTGFEKAVQVIDSVRNNKFGIFVNQNALTLRWWRELERRGIVIGPMDLPIARSHAGHQQYS
jgi:hypothetical protein